MKNLKMELLNLKLIVCDMLLSVDRTMRVIRSSGLNRLMKRISKIILSNLVKEEALLRKEGRHYTYFSNYKSSILDDLDAHKMYQWINDHKKKIHGGHYR